MVATGNRSGLIDDQSHIIGMSILASYPYNIKARSVLGSPVPKYALPKPVEPTSAVNSKPGQASERNVTVSPEVEVTRDQDVGSRERVSRKSSELATPARWIYR